MLQEPLLLYSLAATLDASGQIWPLHDDWDQLYTRCILTSNCCPAQCRTCHALPYEWAHSLQQPLLWCTESQRRIPSGPLAACLQMLGKRSFDYGASNSWSGQGMPASIAMSLITAFGQLFKHLERDGSVPAQQQQGESHRHIDCAMLEHAPVSNRLSETVFGRQRATEARRILHSKLPSKYRPPKVSVMHSTTMLPAFEYLSSML